MRCYLIVNPIAKQGRAIWHALRAQQRLSSYRWQCELFCSESGGHVTKLAESAIKQGMDAVLVCGGDGTIHYAVQTLAYSNTPLGIIPCGRGNDLVRALGIPLNTEASAPIINQNHVREIDLGIVQGRYFCGIVTCGFDSEVADFVFRYRKVFGSWLGYYIAALFLLLRYRFRDLHLLSEEGLEFSGKVLLAATANCPAYGGGLKIAPTAKLDDGWLNLCIVRQASKLKILWMLPTVFTGKHIYQPEVSLHFSRRVFIESGQPIMLFADGEPIAMTPVEVTIAPKALKVFVPKES